MRMSRMRRILGPLLVIAFLAPPSHALTTRGAGVLADGLALSVFGLSRERSAGTPVGHDLSLATGAPGLFPPPPPDLERGPILAAILPVSAPAQQATPWVPSGSVSSSGSGSSGMLAAPEPATFVLLSLGLIGLAAMRRRSTQA